MRVLPLMPRARARARARASPCACRPRCGYRLLSSIPSWRHPPAGPAGYFESEAREAARDAARPRPAIHAGWRRSLATRPPNATGVLPGRGPAWRHPASAPGPGRSTPRGHPANLPDGAARGPTPRKRHNCCLPVLHACSPRFIRGRSSTDSTRNGGPKARRPCPPRGPYPRAPRRRRGQGRTRP